MRGIQGVIQDPPLEERLCLRPEDFLIFDVLNHIPGKVVRLGLPQARYIRLAVRCPRRGSRQVRFSVSSPRNIRSAEIEPLGK
jgi:hypothetical protein